MNKKKYIIVGLLILVMIIGIVVTRCASKENTPKYISAEKRTPEEIIEENLGMTIPDTASVIEFRYPKHGYFYAKILIDEENVSNLERQVILTKVDSEYLDFMPNFRNSCSWWDMKREDIILAFTGFEPHYNGSGGTAYTEAWIFIVKDDDGQYYLYISY